MQTEKLYETDAYQITFDARVVGSTRVAQRPGVILDRTLFYPTSGGQPHDTGIIEGLPVVDVVEQDEAIVHITAADAPTGRVTGAIDWPRRFAHMQQHTGQHVLSQAFVRELEADTTGFHMGETAATIDIQATGLNWQDVQRVEAEANRVVFANLAVRVHKADQNTLHGYALRKPPVVEGAVRIVEIDTYDWSACCGTHVRATGEIGLIKVLRFESYKGGLRVTFVCGQRALQAMQAKTRILETVARRLTLGEAQLADGIERLLANQKQQQLELKTLEKQLRVKEARELLAKAQTTAGFQLVTQTITDRKAKAAHALGLQITANPKAICILGVPGRRATLIVGQSTDGPLDLKAITAYAALLLDGKGGGNNRQIQVSGPDGSKLSAAMQTLSGHICRQIEAAS